ncbi:MAG: type II toxin-antitoxin system RelE/ParE family toxin [Burkholderiales bacterium]|jgi:plasmid stabilization system protein ParE|nr:type II toxin-antitoxin system RelE/ParE family toxin [Burkholderiales bacterium]
MRVEIDEEALAEAADARDYYTAVNQGLGHDFLIALDRAINRIIAQPSTWPSYTRRTRRYLMDRFPYAVIYMVREDTIRVLAIAHQHRRPGYWTERLP